MRGSQRLGGVELGASGRSRWYGYPEEGCPAEGHFFGNSESEGKDRLGAGSLELLKAASKMLRSLH